MLALLSSIVGEARTVSPNSRDTAQGFLKVCVNRALRHTIQTLQLARGTEVISLDVAIKKRKRYHARDEWRCCHAYDDNCG